ncbi:hypothetical protein LTR95_011320 [Oleoguttula sp. CCFEE 5521]
MILARILATVSSIACSALGATNTTTRPPYAPTAAPIFQLSSDAQFAFILRRHSISPLGEVPIPERPCALPHRSSRMTLRASTRRSTTWRSRSMPWADPSIATRIRYLPARRTTTLHPTIVARTSSFTGIRVTLVLSLYGTSSATYSTKRTRSSRFPERFTVEAHSVAVGDYEAIGIFDAAYADPRSGARPTIVVGGGYDSSQEEGYHAQCRQILSRGINCVTYEGPGMPTVRRQQNIGFVADWWSATIPVVDYRATRPDVDMSRLALVGMSFGGILAPVAASHDDRFSAVTAIDEFSNAQTAFKEQFPEEIVQLFDSGNVTAFDKVMTEIAANVTYPSNVRWVIGYGL